VPPLLRSAKFQTDVLPTGRALLECVSPWTLAINFTLEPLDSVSDATLNNEAAAHWCVRKVGALTARGMQLSRLSSLLGAVGNDQS
jgi:hypothetical protein